MEFVLNLHGGPSAVHVISELIFHPNLGHLCTAAETPLLDDLHMVDIFVVFKTIQAAGVSVHIHRNSKTHQCAHISPLGVCVKVRKTAPPTGQSFSVLLKARGRGIRILCTLF